MTAESLHTDEPAPDPALDRGAIAFIRMWAIAHLIHLSIAYDNAIDTPWGVASYLAAAAVLVSPQRIGLTATLAGLQIVDAVAEMPDTPDHWMLAAFVNAIMLCTFAARRELSTASVCIALQGARGAMLITYAAAALSKYNVAFLDPVTSCASAIASRATYGVSDAIPVDGLWLWATIVAETAIPLLLVVPFTRRHGVRVALGFHFMLSASPAFAVVDYTAILFALMLTFLPSSDLGRILDTLGRLGARSAIARDVRAHPRVAVGLVMAVCGFSALVIPKLGNAVTLVLSEGYLALIVAAALWTWRRTARPDRIGAPALAHLGVILFVALWVASPYLGGRTTAVFTMFSGVKTEPGVENHLFLPTIRVLDWQDDLLVITGSNDPRIAAGAERELAIPLLQLELDAAADPDLTVDGILAGESVRFGPGPTSTHFEAVPWWAEKFILLRPVTVGDGPFCSVS